MTPRAYYGWFLVMLVIASGFVAVLLMQSAQPEVCQYQVVNSQVYANNCMTVVP